MKTFQLIVSSPDGDLFKGDVVMLSLRGAEGDLAIMAGHIPFITSVKPGICRIETEDDEVLGSVESGILSVSADGATLLTGSFHRES